MSTDWGIGCRTCRDAGKPREDYFPKSSSSRMPRNWSWRAAGSLT